VATTTSPSARLGRRPAGHPHEEHRHGRELPDGPLGDDRGRVVALTGEGQHHLAGAAPERADLEAGAGDRGRLPQVGEHVPDGVVLDVQRRENDDGRPIPSTIAHATNHLNVKVTVTPVACRS
jgi:hypothetical protein